MGKIYILSFFIPIILTYVFMPMLLDLIENSDLVELNFQKKYIPNSMGITFIFTQLLSIGLIKIFFNWGDELTTAYLMGFIFIGLLGFLDDVIGTDEYKGLKGHFQAFFKGKLTTGNIKALLGGFIGVLIGSYINNEFYNIIINGILIALFTNFMNLFDLRPGRAGKVFIIIGVTMLIISRDTYYNPIIIGLLGTFVVYLKYDLRASLMMGDTGSNILGYTLGFNAAINYGTYNKLIIIGILLILHYRAEKVSFSKKIRENKVLNYIDMLGR